MTAGRWPDSGAAAGTVAVIGMGKIGLPLAAQYASRGWHVIGVDVVPAVVDAINEGRVHFEEPGLADRVSTAYRDGLLEATLDHADAVRRADVVVIIVPVMLTQDHRPDLGIIDAATRAAARKIRPGTLLVYETTLPVGTTRNHFAPLLEHESGMHVGAADGLLLAFSPERVFSGRIFTDLATYPKLVGGVDAASTERAIDFYRSVLTAPIWDLGTAEAAEFAKLAETTYRDVNVALANEFARYAERVGVDIREVIRGANSQPFSHIHAPGLGTGGHCIPVYPHFLLSSAPDMMMVATSRSINDGQVGVVLDAVEGRLGPLAGMPVLVLGITYRANVHELAYSRGLALVEELRARGARVSAHDPLMTEAEIEALGVSVYQWGEPSDAKVIVTQTADTRWSEIDAGCFPDLAVLFDGRNSLRGIAIPVGVTYMGVGVAPRPGGYGLASRVEGR